jgi:phage terminase small subunit
MTEEQANELNETEAQTPDEPTGLSPRNERFCLEYLKDFNAAAAARRVGYSAGSAKSTGYRILNLPEAQEFLKCEQLKINADMNRAAQAVNKELLDITFLKRGDFLDEQGDLKNLNDLPENMRAAVQVSTRKIKCDDKVTTITTYNLFDKIQMMEKISKRQVPVTETAQIANEDKPEIEDLGNGLTVEV